MKQPWYGRLKFWGRQQKTLTDIQSILLRNTASWSARNFVAFATEGFQQNSTVRACVGAIQEAAKTCPVVIQNPDGSIIDQHPLLDFLQKPNSAQGWEDFLDAMVGNKLISGEGDVWGNAGGSRFIEMWVLRPDWLEPQIVGGALIRWRYTPTSTDSYIQSSEILPDELLVWKNYNPFDCWRGFSPLWSCAFAIDTLNQYAKTNKALLDNDARPSGILSAKDQLSDTSFNRLKRESREEYSGSENNGKLMVTDGGLTYQAMGFSPREMEFIAGKLTTEQDICKVLRVPGQIIGLPGSQTFANYEQARAAFYEDNVIPMVNSLLASLTRWAGPRFKLKPGQKLIVDVEGVAALEPRRTERNKAIDAMTSLSINEKRNAMNYDDADYGDVILVQSSLIPLDLAGSDMLTTDPVTAAVDAGIKPTKPAAGAE